jgi:GxxExxY protein
MSTEPMHPLYSKANALSWRTIGAAIEVHRIKGPGLIESIYERSLMRELELRNISAVNQMLVDVDYKGYTFQEPLRADVLVENCLIIENKVVEKLLPVHKAQLLSYMKLLNAPIGLLINYHELVLKNGIVRLILENADRD